VGLERRKITMGLFGETDASEVPNDPFYVAPDTYFCTLAEVKRVAKKDGTGEGLAFKWVIQEDDSEYNGNNVQDWKNIYPGITADEVTPDIRKDNARLKGRLAELGLNEDQMNDLLDNLDDLVGLEAYVTVSETQGTGANEGKTFTNVKSVRVDE
jgi:hypothetical protein